ncbi:hypothetical protein H1Q59_07745 [Holosporaceae bacterium 'Namur']|nr:hypothetical protein [Holosporaceae bacterium 'Namur']
MKLYEQTQDYIKTYTPALVRFLYANQDKIKLQPEDLEYIDKQFAKKEITNGDLYYSHIVKHKLEIYQNIPDQKLLNKIAFVELKDEILKILPGSNKVIEEKCQSILLKFEAADAFSKTSNIEKLLGLESDICPTQPEYFPYKQCQVKDFSLPNLALPMNIEGFEGDS